MWTGMQQKRQFRFCPDQCFSSNCYGGVWASYNLDTLNNFFATGISSELETPADNLKELLRDGETILRLGSNIYGIKNVKHQWHVPE